MFNALKIVYFVIGRHEVDNYLKRSERPSDEPQSSPVLLRKSGQPQKTIEHEELDSKSMTEDAEKPYAFEKKTRCVKSSKVRSPVGSYWEHRTICISDLHELFQKSRQRYLLL